MISIEYVPLFFRESTRRRSTERKRAGEKEEERKRIEIIRKISTARNTKERSVEAGEIIRTEIKTKQKAWDRTLRRIINMSIENQKKEGGMKQSNQQKS